MMKYKVLSIIIASTLLITNSVFARKYEGKLTHSSGKRAAGGNAPAANCSPPSTRSEMELNNVRMLIHTGGDMWWDLVGVPRYEIPKNSGRTALFAGSLWLGGEDQSGQLKLAALKFRSEGYDFWTGPLNTVTSEITPERCSDFDQHFRTTRNEVSTFRAWFNCNADPDCDPSQEAEFEGYQIPSSILDWPAHGRDYGEYMEDYYLAPFEDVDGNGEYNPAEGGDYPRYDLDGTHDCAQRQVDIYGDENLWWIFNDRGNIHTETGGEAIGMEIRAQAFQFATNDEVNNMSFYNYELVNRSTYQLTNTYFGFWVDPDLGNAQDDYVGCDVQRGLGYCYNGDENDEDAQGALGYGTTPPAIGADFFQGPFQDSDDKDNCLCLDDYNAAIADDGIPYDGLGVGYGDSIIDNERLGMRAFLYYNNSTNNVNGEPNTASQYYGYLRSYWKDNSHMVYGGDGTQGDNTPPYVQADFMFPADSDPVGWGTGGNTQQTWTEVTAGNNPQDRRFIQSSGPFILSPGAVNNITVGVVWSRASSGSAQASVDKLLVDDQKTQALFDACFQILDGPDAPSVDVTELDKKLVLQIVNPSTSNNYNEAYSEVDPFIVAPDSLSDEEAEEYQTFRFQGYQIYQLRDASVSASDVYDETQARLIYQCDIKDNITDLTNFVFSDEVDAEVAYPRVENANNDGIVKSFEVVQDAFAEGDRSLINHKTYYFMVIAYAHNDFRTYNPSDPATFDGQREPYLPSRQSANGAIPITTGIPHKTDPQEGGLRLRADYGDGVPVTKIEGKGNSGYNINLSAASVDNIMSGEPWLAESLTYEAGAGPIEVKIIDPLNVAAGDYTLMFNDTSDLTDMDDATWSLYSNDELIAESSGTVSLKTEQLIPEIGISITMENINSPGLYEEDPTNGLIFSEMIFDDYSNEWLTGLNDADGTNYGNWIRSGQLDDEDNPVYNDYNGPNEYIDPDQVYEGVISGTWAPYRLVGSYTHQPGARVTSTFEEIFSALPINSDFPGYQLSLLNNVNIYITSDQSKWTRCAVVEAQDDPSLAYNSGRKLLLRQSPSVDKNGNPADTGVSASTDENNAAFISPTGMGWFPGYAIDVETGERLNMAFAEDSYLISENGRDMIWNPTSNRVAGAAGQDIRFGGKHWIYVFRNNIVEEQQHQFPLSYNQYNNRVPAYDYGAFISQKLTTEGKTSSEINSDFRDVWRACTWTGFPMLRTNEELLSSDVTIRLRVNSSFKPYKTTANENKLSIGSSLEDGVEYLVLQGPVEYNNVTYAKDSVIVGLGSGVTLNATAQTGSDTIANVVATRNGGRPMFTFNLDNFVPERNVISVAEDALDLINVVPNPYYAYANYETSKTDNRVKFVNLPERCNIKIYTLNGVLVREFRKDDPSSTSLDWDLKNFTTIPIASGVYLIHVDVPGVGERVIKWFAVMRPVDLDSF